MNNPYSLKEGVVHKIHSLMMDRYKFSYTHPKRIALERKIQHYYKILFMYSKNEGYDFFTYNHPTSSGLSDKNTVKYLFPMKFYNPDIEK